MTAQLDLQEADFLKFASKEPRLFRDLLIEIHYYIRSILLPTDGVVIWVTAMFQYYLYVNIYIHPYWKQAVVQAEWLGFLKFTCLFSFMIMCL